MDDQVKCPKCLSTQITANKKGFSGTNAVAGAILTGGVGLLAGTIGSNKVKITCLSCGYTFNPGDKPLLPVEPIPEKTMMTALIVFTIFVALVTTIAIIISKS